MNSSHIGTIGEKLAAAYIKNLNYLLLARNFSCKLGEIDLICLDHKTLVFIEVKSRSSHYHGEPYQAVSRRKINKIARVGKYFSLIERMSDRYMRIDVVSILFSNSNHVAELTHYSNITTS